MATALSESVRPEQVSPSAQPLTSVGIDVGSATTQVMVSRLWVDLAGELMSSRLEVIHREVLHASPLQFTPFIGGTVIDSSAIRDILSRAYAEVGVSGQDVEIGALIVTGEAARKANAAAVAQAVAELAGSFVCVSAGPHLEARLAAHGSGMLGISAARPDRRLLHVDIGGATTKLAVLDNGVIVASAATNVGARMLTVEAGRIIAASKPLVQQARLAGLAVEPGMPADPKLLIALAEALAANLIDVIAGRPGPADDAADPSVTAPLDHSGPFHAVGFSGGVAAYVYGDECQDYGDLGPYLGPAVLARLTELGGEILRPPRTACATVLGASQFTTQVSGTTTHQTDQSTLPVRALRAILVAVPDGPVTAEDMGQRIRRAYAALDLRPDAESSMVVLGWRGDPSLSRLDAVAQALNDTLPVTDGPLVVAMDGDLGAALGSLVERRRPGTSFVCLDEVSLSELDVVDVGAPVLVPPVLPVVIRSVAFM